LARDKRAAASEHSTARLQHIAPAFIACCTIILAATDVAPTLAQTPSKPTGSLTVLPMFSVFFSPAPMCFPSISRMPQASQLEAGPSAAQGVQGVSGPDVLRGGRSTPGASTGVQVPHPHLRGPAPSLPKGRPGMWGDRVLGWGLVWWLHGRINETNADSTNADQLHVLLTCGQRAHATNSHIVGCSEQDAATAPSCVSRLVVSSTLAAAADPLLNCAGCAHTTL
jgi:hypothetical protein